MQKKIKNLIIERVRKALKTESKQNVRAREALEQWLVDLKDLPPPRGRVLITALRNYTWIEWAAYAAAFIRQWGYESTLIFKEREVTHLYNENSEENFWEGVKKIPGIRLVNLENLSFDKDEYKRYFDACEKDAVAALAYDLHLESANILEDPGRFGSDLHALKKECAHSGATVRRFLSENKFDQFICYSGLISDTSCILKAALDSGQEVVCVEGWAWRHGHMIYNFNSPALEYNVHGWMRYFGAWDEKKNKEMSDYFGFLNGQEQNEEWLKTFHNVQLAKVSDEIPEHIAKFTEGPQPVFLLACNVIGDSSLLNRETIFKSHCEFIEETVLYFSKRKDMKLIIRAHPAEGWVKGKVRIKMGDFATRAAKGISNVLVVNDNEKVNTFSLLPLTHAGLVWVTSAGVDMVVRGIPVIAAAKPKYSGLGIVEEPTTKEAFFRLIEMYSKSDKRPSLQQIQKAKEYLYLVFKGFSFEAQGRNFRADTCKLNDMPAQSEHDQFFKILLKLETAPDHVS